MSNPYSEAYRNPEPNQFPTREPQPSNGLGTAGFVVSLIGLLTCGSLSIFGLVISLFGLRKKPKGLAITGAILGAVGLIELGLAVFAVYNTVQAFGNMQASLYKMANQSTAEQIARDVAKEWESTGQLPSEAEGLVDTKLDVYGNAFEYETDGSSFTIRSAGQDQEFNTEDDIEVGPFLKAQEVFDQLGEEGEFELDMEDELELEDETVEKLEQAAEGFDEIEELESAR